MEGNASFGGFCGKSKSPQVVVFFYGYRVHHAAGPIVPLHCHACLPSDLWPVWYLSLLPPSLSLFAIPRCPRFCFQKNDRSHARSVEPARVAGKLLPPPRLPRAEKLLKVQVPAAFAEDNVSVVDDQQQHDHAHGPSGGSFVSPHDRGILPGVRCTDEVKVCVSCAPMFLSRIEYLCCVEKKKDIAASSHHKPGTRTLVKECAQEL